MANRFFLEAIFSEGQKQILEGTEFHHLANVMRVEVGELIELVNGKNQLAKAVVENLSKRSAELTILTIQESPQKKSLTLAQALFRPPRLEWLVEKAVELGASEIWLFPTTRSEKKSLSEAQLARLEQISISALKQCHRLDLPQIQLFSSLAEVPTPGTLFFGDLRPNTPAPSQASLPATLFIGPEGGFTDEEIRYLEQKGAKGIHLHENILRAETAAIAALCAFAHSC